MAEYGSSIWLDGKIVARDSAAHVPLLTHTLHYGVGAFEGIRAYRRAGGETMIFRLREHVQRLFDSCKLVMIEPSVSVEQVCRGCVDVLLANQLEAGYLRPIVLLGEGAMGLYPQGNPVLTFIAAWAWGAYLGKDALEHGIRCKVASYARPHVNVSFSRAKLTGQYIVSVMAKREVKVAGYDEALLLDLNGMVAEGSGENVFIVKAGRLITPPLSSAILAGITRDTVLTLAREEGIPVVEQSFPRDDLLLADEAFLTGTAAEITPVREVDDRRIGDGRVGPVTRLLQERYFALVRGSRDDHPDWLTLVARTRDEA
ncbi:MAG TPA: branched-chain amino acid transaminase [Polyangiaceae bacterium]|nr:branched-chain amino acid transaminase [Polyangiaceae bacterium]